MWFSVVCTIIDNDTRHHSGQNVMDSRGAATLTTFSLPRQINQSGCEISSNCGKKVMDMAIGLPKNTHAKTKLVRARFPRASRQIHLLSSKK